MRVIFKTLAVATAAAVVSSGALAALSNVNAENFGNSSLVFVATDNTDQIQLVVDLGLNMADMLQTAPLVQNGSSVSWNFATNTVNGANITGNDWTAAYNTFKSAQQGGDYRWAVIAGDSISGNVSGTNTIQGRGVMATGNVTVAQMTAASTSTPTGTALGNALNFYAASKLLGTISTANNGAGVTTGGDVVTGVGAMGGTFGGAALSWNYLIANGVSSTFQYQQQVVANPSVFQLGRMASATDVLNAEPFTFSFDIASDSLVLAPVPEPGTYALMLAGLAGLAFLAKRRQG